MTDTAALLALHGKATPGPYRHSAEINVCGKKGTGAILRATEQFMDRKVRIANAEYATAAMNAVPALCAEVDAALCSSCTKADAHAGKPL